MSENVNQANNQQPEVIAQKPLSHDDLTFQKLLQNFSKLSKYIKKDLNNNKNTASLFTKNFNKETVMTWMQNPARYTKQLRNLSRFLYDESLHYKRIVQYFASFLTFDYVVELYRITDFSSLNEKIVEKKYLETLNFLDNMNIKHEFGKAHEIAWRDDIFFGYEWETTKSYYIQQLDPDYCDITAYEDGVPVVSFDFSYFRKDVDALLRYPSEFTQKYELYKSNTKEFKWQELDSYKTVVIKINEIVDYPIPPLAGLFFEVTDIYDYRELKKARTELENYLLLVFKIPYLKDPQTANAFALTMDNAIKYFDMAMENMPDQVGGLLSPFEAAEAVKVERQDKTQDTVQQAEDSLYNTAGVPKLIFNSDNASGAALTKSVEFDSFISFKILRQIERHINKRLKRKNKLIYFRIEFLNITEDNRKDQVAMYKDGATLGVPCKLKLAAAMGLSPMSVIANNYLEQKVLKISEEWIPLSSSYQTGEDGAGRPQNDEDDLEPSSEVGRELDTNNPDNRT